MPYKHNVGYLDRLVPALRAAGVSVVFWGWSYGKSAYAPYASIAKIEGEVARALIDQYKPDAWIIDAESYWKRPGMSYEVSKYLTGLGHSTLSIPVYVTSYRYPDSHRTFPWKTWYDALKKGVDGWVPQVYWEGDFSADAGIVQLNKSFAQYIANGLLDGLRYFPAPPAYRVGTWEPTPIQVTGFMQRADLLGLSGFMPWSWQHMNIALWDSYARYKEYFNDVELTKIEPFLLEAATAKEAVLMWGPEEHNPAKEVIPAGTTIRIDGKIGKWGLIPNSGWVNIEAL